MNAIEMRNITMTFGTFKANDNLSLKVEKGSVHAIIGENGAGKSTLLSILFGLYKQTKGEIYVNDVLVDIDSPQAANKLGIGMVHQHFKLVDDFTVLQNIVLNSEDKIAKMFVTYKKARQKVEELMRRYKFGIDLNKKIANCSVAEQQRTEILKMLYKDSDILIFDEPTAVLSPQQITEFLKAIKHLQKQGKTIIIISHKLEELKEVADNATVIRHGKLIGTVNPKTASVSKISTMMVGTKVAEPKKAKVKIEPKVILDIENLNVNKLGKRGVKGLKDFNLKIHAGEILAIAGLEGSGQTELINAISGLQKPTKGKITITHDFVYIKKQLKDSEEFKKIKVKSAHRKVTTLQNIIKNNNLEINQLKSKNLILNSNIANEQKVKFNTKRLNQNSKRIILLKNKAEQAQKRLSEIFIEDTQTDMSKVSINKKYKLGMSHIPEDRHKHGLVLSFDLNHNSILQQHNEFPFSRFGLLKFGQAKRFTREIMDKFDVRTSAGPNSIAKTLSGGNQQKYIVGREILSYNNFIIIAQPTRGLDVGAINNIHKHILKAQKEGKAILLVSYELDEVLKLADRIVVLSGGQKTGELLSKDANATKVGKFMAGINSKRERGANEQ